MKKKTAEKIIGILLECSKELNQVSQIANDELSVNESKEFNRLIGNLMGNMLIDILNPIFEEYPDLAPNEFHLNQK